jgi:hypothetical protein
MLFVMTILFTLISCKNNPTGSGSPIIIPAIERVYIIDATEKQWDITHAQQEYGMIASNFKHGLGPFAIEPINNPSFLAPGDSGYPKNTDTFMVMGVTLNGESRAYSMSTMGFHEVVNDSFGNIPVAITN